MSLTDYRTLGRSGLVVSPLTLGTMTFGNRSWGTAEDASRAIFDAYVDAGGNVIDTADVYAGGRSETLLGEFIAARGLRDQIVLATKAGFGREPGNPNAGGNGAKNIHAALESSLRRLRTDYVDLFWVHVWDVVTPAEDVLQTLGNLVRSGKIRYFGLSNTPAFYVAKMATLAEVHFVPGPIALQLEYSLTERMIEREHVPAARTFGLGITPWSPLSGGFLTGKYHRDIDPTEGRLSGSNPFGDTKFSERNWTILDALRRVAEEVGRPPAQVALAWASAKAQVSTLVLGASSEAQLQGNIASREVVLTPSQRATLDDASSPDAIYPYPIFSPAVNKAVFGGTTVIGGLRP